MSAAIGLAPQILTTRINWPVTLAQKGSIATFDFDAEVAGYPYFVVSALNRPVQIEVKYSEQFDGLNHPWGDGPYDYVISLASTYRVETFNVTQTGRFQSFFLQGGQRWESIRLLTNGHVSFSEVGLQATIDLPDLDNLPSTFESSNGIYNAIWKLGANSIAAACFNAGSQKQTWEITDDGIYVPGQKAAVSALGNNFEKYTLKFYSKIVRGGTGWSTVTSVGGSGLNLLLISNLPSETTFVNTNQTLTPANSLVLASGWGFVNQTTLDSYFWGSFKVPFDIKEGEWYEIETSHANDDFLVVSVNGIQIVNLTLAHYPPLLGSFTSGSGARTQGSFGFGPYQDQIAYFRNATVTAANGTQIYHSYLTSQDVLAEYGTHENWATTCVDGPKRDRLVWLGDFFHTSRSLPASTSRWDYVKGTLQYLIDWQVPNGEVSIDPPLGYSPAYTEQISGGSYGLPDYQILGLNALTNYYGVTGDLDFPRDNWPAFQRLIQYLLNNIDNSTNLLNIGGFIGPELGTATSACLVQGLKGAAIIADDLNDHATANIYRNTATDVANAINTHLWSPTEGFYAVSTSNMSDFSLVGLGFAITSGVATATRATSTLAKLDQIKLYPAYADNTQEDSSSNLTKLSPNTNGFLLSALLLANQTEPAKYLLDNLWAAMYTQNQFRSGGTWEYVNQNLSPGLSLFTSLGHPWGNAPTYVLPEFVAGLWAVAPGYKTWLFGPGYKGFDLSYANTTISTKFGSLKAGWSLNNQGNQLTITIDAPVGTSGSVALPANGLIETYNINGREEKNEDPSEPLAIGSSMTTIVVQI